MPKDSQIDNPDYSDIHEWGVYAKMIRVIEMPDTKNLTVIIQGLGRCNLSVVTTKDPFYEGYTVSNPETMPSNKAEENIFAMAIDDLREVTADYIRKNEEIPNESQIAINNIQNNILALNFICTNICHSALRKRWKC